VETKASAKYIRISARKMRLVVDLVRDKDVAEAQQILDYSPRAAARVVSKVLNSAIANAEHNNGLDADDLFVARVFVDEGPTLKRFRPRALGRATRINKRTSHITLILDEREPRPEAKRRRLRRKPKPKAAEAAEPLEAEVDEAELDADEVAEEAAEVELDETLEQETDEVVDEAELNADEMADKAVDEAESDTDATADENKSERED